MSIRPQIYLNKYSVAEWNAMAEAYELAFHQIRREDFVERHRLARSVITFFDKGIHDVSALTTLALTQEKGSAASDRTHANMLASGT